MRRHSAGEGSTEPTRGSVQTTRSELVQMAQDRARAPEQAQRALGELCLRYRQAICAFMRHARGAQNAEDLAQGFIEDVMRRGIEGYDRSRGRFRNWLFGALRSFVGRKRQHDRAQCRNVVGTSSYDALLAEARSGVEPRHTVTPERAFRSAMALCAAQDAWHITRAWHVARGEGARFDRLERMIPGDELSDLEYERISEDLGVSMGAARKAVHDLRQRYRETLRSQICETVLAGCDIDDELRALIEAARWVELA